MLNKTLRPVPTKKTIYFPFGDAHTTIHIGYSILAQEFSQMQDQYAELIIIADKHVSELWKNEIDLFRSAGSASRVYIINPVETEKSLSTVCLLLEKIMSEKPSRSCTLVSFGGGLTGNIAGVISGLLFRGVRLIHIPTTLLAMSDSILSQKQAVNGAISKNSFGLFRRAELNIVDLKFLSTLPSLQVYSGIIEILKNCLAFDRASIESVSRILKQPFTPETLCFLVETGIDQKRVLLEKDPYEMKEGIILEYGHTIGHSLEINSSDLHHGQAVGLGMLAAASISEQRGWLNRCDVELHVELLSLCRCPLRILAETNIESVMQSVMSDNKKGKITHGKDETPMVLLKQIGMVAKTKNDFLVPVSYQEIEAAIRILQTDFFEKMVQHPTTGKNFK